MNLDMTQERSDNLLQSGIIEVTSDITSGHTNFVRKLNKDGTKFEHVRNSWGKLAERRSGSYGQN